MSFTATTPPTVGDVEAVVAALLDVAATQAYTGASGRVGYGVEPTLPALTKSLPGRLLVRRRSGPNGKKVYLDRVTSVELNIRADVKSNMGGDPGLFLSGLHGAVFSTIEGASPSLVGASVLHPLRMIEEESRVMADTKEGYLYSRTVYKIVLQPA